MSTLNKLKKHFDSRLYFMSMYLLISKAFSEISGQCEISRSHDDSSAFWPISWTVLCNRAGLMRWDTISCTPPPHHTQTPAICSEGRHTNPISASKSSIWRFVITEKAPTRAFSWLKAATTAFTFKTLLRHYAKRSLTPRSLNMKLGPWRNYHKGQVG